MRYPAGELSYEERHRHSVARAAGHEAAAQGRDAQQAYDDAWSRYVSGDDDGEGQPSRSRLSQPERPGPRVNLHGD